MLDGESATDALRRYEREKYAARVEKSVVVRAQVAASLRPNWAASRSVLRGSKIVPIAAAAAVTVLMVELFVAQVAGGLQVAGDNYASGLDPIANAQIATIVAEEEEQAAADLAKAIREGKVVLSDALEFQVHSQTYITKAQAAELVNDIDVLDAAIRRADSTVRVELAVLNLESLIAEIGPEDTPEQRAARQAEADAEAARLAEEAARLAEEAAAAAQVLAEDNYIAVVVAGGWGVDETNRERVLQAAKDFCAKLVNAGGSASGILTAVKSSYSPVVPAAAAALYCPQFIDWVNYAALTFGDGSRAVGSGIAPGTYTTLDGNQRNCYWERSDGQGNIIDNNFITFAPNPVSVTVYSGEGFSTSGCGLWGPG